MPHFSEKAHSHFSRIRFHEFAYMVCDLLWRENGCDALIVDFGYWKSRDWMLQRPRVFEFTHQ
jgi:hypothetical protein